MTLGELSDLLYSYADFPCEAIVIYEDLDPEDIEENEILFTLKSHYNSKFYIQEKFLNAKVEQIYAYEQDKFIVAIENTDKFNLDNGSEIL